MTQLVLSLFPGADLFGMAFEAEGFCVVRGPDVLLGGDVRTWNCVAGKFDGIIGGPPCKAFSAACEGQVALQGNLIPEFERLVAQAAPTWWVMENVVSAPLPRGVQYNYICDAWDFGARQHRTRMFSSNIALKLQYVSRQHKDPDPYPTVTATEHKYSNGKTGRRRAGRKLGRKLTLEEVNVLMGLPVDFTTPALKAQYQYQVRGNGIPLQMGLAIARAVKESS